MDGAIALESLSVSATQTVMVAAVVAVVATLTTLAVANRVRRIPLVDPAPAT